MGLGMGGWVGLGMGGWVDCRNGCMGGCHIANHRGWFVYYVFTVSILICYEVNGLRNGTGYNVRNFFFSPVMVMM